MITIIIYIACTEAARGSGCAKPAPASRRKPRRHSHSMVAGGLLEMS